MKTFRKMLSASRRLAIEFLCLWAAVIGLGGCGGGQSPVQPVVQPGDAVSIERIHISALTEFVTDPAHPDKVQLKVFLELFDAFDSPVSVPCVLRFELYEFHSVSSDPRGKRLVFWPERDMRNPEIASEYWKDLLRGYEFYLSLDLTPRSGKQYIFEATCLADQKRHHDLFKVKFQPQK